MVQKQEGKCLAPHGPPHDDPGLRSSRSVLRACSDPGSPGSQASPGWSAPGTRPRPCLHLPSSLLPAFVCTPCLQSTRLPSGPGSHSQLLLSNTPKPGQLLPTSPLPLCPHLSRVASTRSHQRLGSILDPSSISPSLCTSSWIFSRPHATVFTSSALVPVPGLGQRRLPPQSTADWEAETTRTHLSRDPGGWEIQDQGASQLGP